MKPDGVVIKSQETPRSEFRETAKDVFASFIGASACVYTGQPFDTVKVRLQLSQGTHYSGSLNCLKDMVKTEGPTKLWSGSIAALMGAVLENASAFAINGFLKRVGDEKEKGAKPSIVEGFATGAFTGFCTAWVLCPCDVLKCRAQAVKTAGLANNSLMHVYRSTIHKEGFSGLYTGIGAQIIRDIPFYATFFGVYDAICQVLKERTDWSEPVVYGTAGGLAGQAAWAASIVADVVKSTIQVADKPLTFMQTYRNIVAKSGIWGLFAGFEVAIIRAYPANAALFIGYEFTKQTVDNAFS